MSARSTHLSSYPRKMSDPLSEPKSRRRRGQRHGDLPEALRTATLALIEEKGARGFSMSEVARAAGVSASAPYNHYADMDALVADIAARAYAQMADYFTAAARTVAPSRRLEAVARAYVQFALTHRPEFEAVFATTFPKENYPELHAAGAVLTGVLADAAATALDRPVDDEAIGLAVEVMALSHGYAVFLLRGALGDAETVVEDTLERVGRATSALLATSVAGV